MVQVDSGFNSDTVLTFKGMGNQCPKHESSNLVIKFCEHEHKQFRRSGENLILTHAISFEDVLMAKPVCVRTLDGRNLTLAFDEFISPQTVRCVTGEGMPRSNPTDLGKPVALMPLSQRPKGDLYLRFDIHFPKMTNEQRQKVMQALRKTTKSLNDLSDDLQI